MYHVSSVDLGKIVELKPRIPSSRCEEEDDITPRVCFAPTIKQCLMGIEGTSRPKLQKFLKKYIVYQCKTPEVLIPAENERVPDFYRTQEHWSLVPIMVEKIGVVGDLHLEKIHD